MGLMQFPFKIKHRLKPRSHILREIQQDHTDNENLFAKDHFHAVEQEKIPRLWSSERMQPTEERSNRRFHSHWSAQGGLIYMQCDGHPWYVNPTYSNIWIGS